MTVTNARTAQTEGTRAQLRNATMSPYKARAVLELIRNQPVAKAQDALHFSDRAVAVDVGKVLASAVANAQQNDGLDPDELYVSACFVDEAPTLKRWRPRARGRATRIRKRTCHITVVVSRLPEDRLAVVRAKQSSGSEARRKRVERSRNKQSTSESASAEATETTDEATDEASDENPTEATAEEQATEASVQDHQENAVEQPAAPGSEEERK